MVYNVIEACETDFYGTSFFTNPILDEQLKCVSKLEGAIQTVRDLKTGHKDAQAAALAEFIFDQRILKHGLNS